MPFSTPVAVAHPRPSKPDRPGLISDTHQPQLDRERLLPGRTLVERQLIPFQDIPVHPPTLPRPRANHCQQPPRLKLPLQRRLNLPRLLQPLLPLRRHALARLRRRLLLTSLPLPLSIAPDVGPIVRLVPGLERRGVNLHDGGASEGVCADEFVVGRMVGHDDDADLARDAFAAPGEVAGFEAQGAVFGVAAAGADEVDAFGADAGVGGLTTFLEGSVRGEVVSSL